VVVVVVDQVASWGYWNKIASNREGSAWLKELRDDMGHMAVTNFQLRVSCNSTSLRAKADAGVVAAQQ
jgi:hypothetical protein